MGPRWLGVLAWIVGTFLCGGRGSCRDVEEVHGAKPASGPQRADAFLRLIPAGVFEMGTPTTERDREATEELHRVEITRPFLLGAREVTRGEFARFVAATGYRTEAETDGEGGWGYDLTTLEREQSPKYHWRNAGFEQQDDHPVINVSWGDAVAYCNWLSETRGLTPFYRRSDDGAWERRGGSGFRLPTEAEWEYACRAGTTTPFHAGGSSEDLVRFANLADATARSRFPRWILAVPRRDGFVFTAPVGRFEPNPWGLYDMHGNVSEWCDDWFLPDAYRRTPTQDPFQETPTRHRIVRGGSWRDFPAYCRSGRRGRDLPSHRGTTLGFRVARSP